MKKLLAKIMSGVVTLAVVGLSIAAAPMLKASAAEKSVTIYFKNTQNWSTVYCYTWQGSGSTGKAWPGSEMKDLGNGWFEATYTGTKPLNVIFNDNNKPTPNQTANHDPADLPLDKDAYWFVPGSESKQDDSGLGGGVTVTVYTDPQEGWPTPQAASDDSGKQADTSASETKDTTPDTGDSSYLPIAAAAAVVSLAGISVLALKRKERV